MKIHLAGSEAFTSHPKIKYEFHQNYLTTFAHFINRKSQKEKVDKIKLHNLLNNCVILDSGAFSKATNKVKFELYDYVGFLKEYGGQFDIYMNLDDVILEEYPSEERIKKSIDYTTNSLNILEKEGLKPIPVYQKKWNRFDILINYLERYKYISLGGLVTGKPNTSHLLIPFLDEVFKLNEKYKVKIHGLGVTADICLKRYPFYSVDSTSWLQGGKSNSCYFNNMDKYESICINDGIFYQKCISPNLFDNPYHQGSNYPERLNQNIRFFNQYERILTELWKQRGIEWNN